MTTTGIEAPGLSFQYADLNILHTGNPQNTLNLVKRAIRMGFDAIAINIDIGDIVPSEFLEDGNLQEDEPKDKNVEAPPAKKKKKDSRKVREQTIPEPFLIDESLLDLTSITMLGRKFRMYSRITFTLNDPSVIHNVFHNPLLKKYDIVAVRPANESILNTLTRKTDSVDIICFDCEEAKVPWIMKGKFMEMIRAEGVGFEVTYGPALGDKEKRRNILTNGRTVIKNVKQKGVIFSSGAKSVIDLRAPVDCMNMLTLWGVTPERARTMISGFPRQILLRAEARRTVRGAVHVTPVQHNETTDAIQASVPSRRLKQADALKKLLTIPSFCAQVEVLSE